MTPMANQRAEKLKKNSFVVFSVLKFLCEIIYIDLYWNNFIGAQYFF